MKKIIFVKSEHKQVSQNKVIRNKYLKDEFGKVKQRKASKNKNLHTPSTPSMGRFLAKVKRNPFIHTFFNTQIHS